MLARSLAQMKVDDLADWVSTSIDSAGRPIPKAELPVAIALTRGIPQRDVTLGNVDRQGTTTWLSVSVEPLRDASSGEVTGAVASFTDITERRRMEAALIDSEATNRALMNSLADGMFVAQDYRFVYANTALPAMLGYGPDEFVDLPFEQVIAPDMLPLWNERFAQRVGAGTEPARSYEVRFLTKDGRGAVPLELIATRATYRGRPAVIGLVRDITERKKAAAELELYRGHLEELVEARTHELTDALAARAETESFTQTITNNIPGRIAYWDRERRCRFVNRIYCEWFGIARELLIGRTIEEIFGPDRWQRVEPRVTAALRGEPQHFERDETGPDGLSATTLVHYMPDVQGDQVRGFFVLALDVTQNRLDQLTLQRLNDELVVARDKAQAAAIAKSAFLANMSHEIRTPMNAIIGLTHLMRREKATPQISERLTRVADAANHLMEIINDILDLSKIESGKLVLEEIDFSLDALLSRACALVSEPAREKGLELLIDTDDLPRMLRGDGTRLSQALVNLLSNAVKFTERGSISLVARLLESRGSEVFVRFEVRDTGIGLEPQQIERIFSPFEQADTSTTRRFGGTGLGLGITRHLARLMGGDAGAESEPGVGSTFWITVKLQARPAPAERPSDRLIAGLHALYVDDVIEAREVMGTMLRQLGLRVEVAGSGADGLALAEAAELAGDPYDVVLIDWLMPHMDGISTAHRLLAQTRGDAPVCILVSASFDPRMREQALDLGITSLLQKPISFSTLHDHLIELLVERSPETRPDKLDRLSEHALRTEHEGARVLLAEDNPVNQEVALTLLQLAGLVVDVAQTGREAVVKASASRYSLILMDMQMPELDGLEAARQLRAQPANADVPIIAMTANAYAEDRAACFAAGMNDHITKPVDPPVLYDMLLRWMPKKPVSKPSALNTGRGLRFFADKQDLYARALRQFADLYAGGIAGAPAFLADPSQPNAEALRRELHSIGGASATIGAEAFAQQVLQLGRLIRENPKNSEIAGTLTNLQFQLAELVAEIFAKRVTSAG
jgi:PAS domain S-box-containing protein